MNCSKVIKRKIPKRIRRKIHNTILKIATALNALSLIFCMCLVDAFTWQPYLIMAFNLGWLYLFAYANGYVYDTKEYYERIEKYGEM